MQGIWEKVVRIFPGKMLNFLCGARTETKFFEEMSSEISQRKCGNLFGGPQTETKVVKWSANRKRLRTAGLTYLLMRDDPSFTTSAIIVEMQLHLGFCSTKRSV